MTNTIMKNIGNFLQDSCLNECQIHQVEQISYINISPHDVENRFLCIQCYQSDKITQEDRNYIISIRQFLLKQEQEPHYKILSEEVRLQVQETLQTKGKVNLQGKIEQFSEKFVEMVKEELQEIQKIADEKTQLINEKKETIEANYNELINPSQIFQIFDQNKNNIDLLNEQIDHYIKLSYVKAKQLQEGNEEYEDLFNEFTLDEAQIIQENVQNKMKKISFYIPSSNEDKNCDNDKSIFEENPIFIDDSSLTLKSRAFLKLIQQIPYINPSLLSQIEKKLIGNPIFEDLEFENEEEFQENNQEEEDGEPLNKEEINQTERFTNIEGKEMAISEAISPIEKSIQKPQKVKTLSNRNSNQSKQKEEISEKELSEFISNALNDQIPYNQVMQNNKNHFRYKSEHPNNFRSVQQSSQAQQNQNNQFQQTPRMTQHPNKQENYFYSQVIYPNTGFSSNLSETGSNIKGIIDQNEVNNETNINKDQMSRIPLAFYQQDSSSNQVVQNYTNIQQSITIDNYRQQHVSNLGGYRSTEEVITQSFPENQNLGHPQIQKHQSANYDTYFAKYNQNELQVNQNNYKPLQSKSRDQSPIKNQAVFQNSKMEQIQQLREKNNNEKQLQEKIQINEEEDEHKASIGGSSGFTMKEFEDYRVSQQYEQNKKQNQQYQGLLQIDGQRFNMKMKKSKLGSTEAISISHQQNNTIIIDSPTDYYAHYIISKDILEPSKEYAFLFSIRCAKSDSILIGITPKEYINVDVLHKRPYYKSFLNTTFESYTNSCERIEKGKSIKCAEDTTLHVVMRVCIASEILSFYDFPKMENINSIKDPSDLKLVKQFYLTIGLTKSKESFNNPSSNPLRIQVLDMRIVEPNNLEEGTNQSTKSPASLN